MDRDETERLWREWHAREGDIRWRLLARHGDGVMPQRPSEEVELRANGVRVLLTPRVLIILLGALGIGSGGVAMAKMVGVATTEDVEALRVDVKASAARAVETETTVGEHTESIQAIVAKLDNVQTVQHEDIADRIADRAADEVRDSRQSRLAWRRTREKVLANLRAGRPARDGIE